MKKILLLLAFVCSVGHTQIIEHRISDDGYARVPLQFPFPYHGRVFTESYMFSNGVVGFLNPTNSWCCTGFDLANTRGTPFDFAIMPLQTDLLNYSGRFLTEGTPQYQRYVWENISEYGVPNNLNTFGVEIRPSGYIGMHYEKVNISPWRPVTIGMTGDTSVGEFTQRYHGAGFSSSEIVSYITQSTGDRCLSDPLSSISCPGYAQAYLTQQCTLNSLYDSSCPGYTEAYHTQQCALNPLYANTCVGYAEAYHTQQCSLNPLYATTCAGYRQAYYNQQCSLNPLYDSGCIGYEAAYFNQQCGLNPLYNSGCQGYEQAYFTYQCTQSALYDQRCPGYTQAYFNQQCSLNALYDRGCSGYAEAYALANVVSTPTTTISAPVLQVSTTGTVSVETPVVSDPVVNEVITRPVNNNATNTTNNVQSNNTTQQTTETKQEKKQDTKQAPKQTASAQNEIPTQTIPQPVHEYKAPIILDLAYQKMVKKPIQDNNRAMYNLIMNSQIKHEEMVNEQYRK